jgi:hypothetical protein
MIEKRIESLLAPEEYRRLLIIDECGFADCFDCAALLRASGFDVNCYSNVEDFRVLYEERLKASTEKIAVIVASGIYVPYDIQMISFTVRSRSGLGCSTTWESSLRAVSCNCSSGVLQGLASPSISPLTTAIRLVLASAVFAAA